jgi:MFS family permease
VKARLVTLIVGSSLAATGLGALLPYLYSAIAQTRGLGAAVAALTFVAFALGSLIAAPLAGRLADGRHPVLVAAGARTVMGASVLTLGFTTTAWSTWSAAGVAGAAFALTQPAISVLLLAETPESPEQRRRQVFAAQFIGMNLALALGGFVAGLTVDLSSPAGTRPIFVLAAGAEVLSAIVVALAGRRVRVTPVTRAATSAGSERPIGMLGLLRIPAIRALVAVTFLLTLACYAQYDSGLPAYAFGTLHVRPATIGTGVALNAILVSVLTVPVVALTRRYQPTTLLAWCGGLWIGCWLIFATPLLSPGLGTGAVLLGYLSISFGESMLAPVLNPFAATLAPDGALGRTLGGVTGAITMGNAIGPGLSGVLLALHLPAGFIALQLACCTGAAALALRLGRQIAHRPQPPGAIEIPKSRGPEAVAATS